MTKDEYTKRLEEIMLKPAFWKYDDWIKAKKSLLQLNNEAIGEDEEVDMGMIKAYGYEAGCWDEHMRNQLRQELRAVIGQDNE